MKAILIPAILLLFGTGAGVGAGMFLAGPNDGQTAEVADHGAEHSETDDDGHDDEAHDPEVDHAASGDSHHGDETSNEYVKLNNQFVVPVVESGRVSAMVVLALTLEVRAGTQADAFAQEPKIRDAFLQVLFEHANIGGFAGNFTSSSNMRVLRGDLRQAAKDVLGDRLIDVLIIDIVRQDIQT